MSASYHHGNLRAELVRHGVALAREKGQSGVVVRETARRAGVSHNAAYRHFRDRDALLVAVAQAGMAELAANMRDRSTDADGDTPQQIAMGRLRAIGRAYVDFALSEPGLFEVTFSPAAAGQPEQIQEAAGPYQLLGEALDDLVTAGAVSLEQRAHAEDLWWSTVHGFALLHLEGPLAARASADRAQALDLILDQIQRFLTAA